MRYKLRSFAFLLGAFVGAGICYVGLTPTSLPARGADADQVLPSADVDPRATLDRAMLTALQASGVAAKVRLRGNLLGQECTGKGEYLQGPTGSLQTRLDMRLKFTHREASLQQISDGQTLWTALERNGQVSLERADLARCLEARSAAGLMAAAPGGAAGWLAALDAAFDFTSVALARLEETPVYVLRGTWRPAYWQRLSPGAEAQPPVDRLPAQVPENCLIAIGREDGWVYRIQLLRTQPGKWPWQPSVEQPLLTLETYDVRFGLSLDPTRFVFDAGGAIVVDGTERTAANLLPLP